MSTFYDELEELIEETIEDGNMTMEAVIADLEMKVAALKEEEGKK